MKTFKQYITEATTLRLKGWGNAKTGKLMLTLIKGNVKPYHSEFAANNISKFGLKEKDAIKAIGGDEGWWDYIKIGNADRDTLFTNFLQKAGWYPITLDDGMNGIAEFGEPVTPRTVHKIAVALDKKYGDRLWAKSYSMFEIGVGGHRKNIQNKFEWEQYLKNKNVPRRTATGAVMSQFREEYITEARTRRWDVSTGQPKLTVLESPSASDIMEFAKNAKYHHARFIINEKGTMWLWDAYDEWHDAMASYLSVYGFLGKSYEMVQGDVSYLDGVKTWVVNIIRVDKKPFDKKNKPLQQIKKIIKPMKHSSWAVGSNI